MNTRRDLLRDQIAFDPMLLNALCVPSDASAATAKYQVPAARPLISHSVVDAPLTVTECVSEFCVVP